MLSLFLYAILILCCLYSGSFLLVFTVLADYFLIFTTHYVPGILCFLIFQMGCRKFLNASLRGMLLPAATASILLFLTGVTSPVILLAAGYGVCLCSNLLCAWKQGDKKLRFIFLLLLLCDLHVAFANLGLYVSIAPGLFKNYQQFVAPYALWLFYLPSQLMLAKMLHRQKTERMRFSPSSRWASSSSPAPRISWKH